MRIREIQFASGVIAKIWRKHHITDNEVREIFLNQPDFEFVERGNVKGEDLYSAWGQTDAGRYLIVFFVYKLNQDALVISARNMTRKERRRYVKK
jgi:uncharacterized DUF497 family protein